MKRAPTPRPDWIRTCTIDHGSGNVIDFPVIDDVPSLLWVINLGCIDLNQWYARCDDVNRPDYVHFDLDPGQGATFDQVRECALIVRDALEALKMKPLVEDQRLEGHSRLRADRPRAGAEGRLDVREGARRGAGEAAPCADDVGISQGETAEGPRAGRLQPEPVGTARWPASIRSGRRRLPRCRRRSTWNEVATRRAHRRLPPRQRSRSGSRRWVISGSRCSPLEDGLT